jgi:peroxin-2
MCSVRRMMRNAASRGSTAGFAALWTGLTAYLTGTTTSPALKNGSKIGRWSDLPVNECAICADNAASDAPQDSSDSLVAPTYLVTGTSAPYMSRISTPPSDVPPEHPINTAYTTSCNHLYCYTCLSDAMLRARDDGGPPWECLRCTEPVTWSERAEADVPNGLDSDGSLDDYEFTDSLGDSMDSIQTLDDSSSEPHSR